MKELVLTGLKESHFPLSALAAFGLLRVCGQEIPELSTARLAWRNISQWTAVLYVPSEVDSQHILDLLANYANTRSSALEFGFADQLRGLTVEQYRQFAEQALDCARQGHRTTVDFAAALAAESPKDPNKVNATAFDMTGGQQRFLRLIRELATALGQGQRRRPSQEEMRRALHEALFGPWRYADRLSSFGWDPAAERLHALQAKSPTREGSPPAVKGAVWLAVEALPLFPLMISNGRLRTSGFDPDHRAFAWPVWTEPITFDALRSLLALGFHNEHWSRLGIAAIFRSARDQVTSHGYGILRPPMLAAGMTR